MHNNISLENIAAICRYAFYDKHNKRELNVTTLDKGSDFKYVCVSSFFREIPYSSEIKDYLAAFFNANISIIEHGYDRNIGWILIFSAAK